MSPARAGRRLSRAQAQREPGTGATWDNRPTFLLGEHGAHRDPRAPPDRLPGAQRSRPRRGGAPLRGSPVGGAEARRRRGRAVRPRRRSRSRARSATTQPWRDVFADVKVHRARCGSAPATSRCRSASNSSRAPRISTSSRARGRGHRPVAVARPRRDGARTAGPTRRVKYEAGLFEVDGATRPLGTANAVRTARRPRHRGAARRTASRAAPTRSKSPRRCCAAICPKAVAGLAGHTGDGPDVLPPHVRERHPHPPRRQRRVERHRAPRCAAR